MLSTSNPWSTQIYKSPCEVVQPPHSFESDPDVAPKKKLPHAGLSSDKAMNMRLLAMRRRANGKGIAFDLDEEWMKSKLALRYCEVTGIEFSGTKSSDPFILTIDRTDNSKGYTKDNCKAVIWIYNQAKKDHGAEHVIQMARALVAIHGA